MNKSKLFMKNLLKQNKFWESKMLTTQDLLMKIFLSNIHFGLNLTNYMDILTNYLKLFEVMTHQSWLQYVRLSTKSQLTLFCGGQKTGRY